MKLGGIFFLSAVCCLFVLAGAARAVETETIGIVPAFPDAAVKNSDAWLLYNLDRGQSRKDAVTVINNKNETVVVKLYAVDATMTADGSFALLQESDPRQSVGGWVKLAASTLELPPKSVKLVPFVFTVPPNAEIGDQMGGIVIEEMGTNGPRVTGSEVRIVTRVGVRVYERVPGELTRGYTLSNFNWKIVPGNPNFWLDLLGLGGRTVFLANIKNEGNARLSPRFTVEIKNIFGRSVGAATSSEGAVIFPGAESSEIGAVWNRIAWIGPYRAKLTAQFSEPGTETATRTLTIWAFPFRLIFWLVILLVVFVILRLFHHYLKEGYKERCPIWKVKSGDTLKTLARKFETRWKKIAWLNDIQKPFALEAGNKIFIPLTRKNKKLLGEMIERGELGRGMATHAKSARYKFIALLVVIAVIAGGYLYFRKQRVLRREVQVPAKPQENPSETASQTIGGAIRPSSIKVAIHNPSAGDQQSTDRIMKKFQLIGYDVSATTSNPAPNDFPKTTVLYAPGKIDEANMVKNDLGAPAEIDLKETENMPQDIVVYNLLPKNNFLEIGTVFTTPQK